MTKTFGFYLLEDYFRKYHCWSISRGLRGLGPIILIGINIVWEMYPLLIELQNYTKSFEKILFHMGFSALVVLVVCCNIQFHRNQQRLTQMINLLSDFNFRNPEGTRFLDKKLKTSLKIIYYGGFFIVFFTTNSFLLNVNCNSFKNTEHCLIMVYYFPYQLTHWQITLLMFFQMYTLWVTLNVLLLFVLLAWYSIEILILRIKSLNEMIGNISLINSKEVNFKSLRPIVLYHQDIFRVCNVVIKFFTSFLIPTKILVSICLTTSIIEFALKRDLISFSLITMTFSSLLVLHTTAQKITTATSSVAEAVYDLNWYEADVSTRKDILNLLCFTQKRFAIELPVFGEMSHAAAAKQYKMVYLFYNWVLNVTKKRYI